METENDSEGMKAKIISEIKRVAELLNTSKISRVQLQQNSKITQRQVYRHFGSWNNAFREAGLEVTDVSRIDDQILFEHTLKLSNYDYDTEVDVNILGHIFEHSLNEIEEIQSEIAGKELDKSKTKRKKDGVFYTPKYITKYIVENTVGSLCTEKKKELEIGHGLNPLI